MGILKNKKYKRILLITTLLTFHILLSTNFCFAEKETTITSDTLEYFEDTSTYVAKGSVKVEGENMEIESDEMSYNEKTSEIIATGNVIYEDAEMSIKASKIQLNTKEDTGMLYEAEILHKKENYRISGKKIEKKGKKYYSAPEATFTTCDPPIPAWCFRGEDIDLLVDERLKAKDVSFRIKDFPVIYLPYISVPFHTERKTGFLMPVFDNSESRGIRIGIPFYWVISEDKDATFLIDAYSKRGIGEGLEFRYIRPDNIKGRWWIYHIKDTLLKRDFLEVRALHEQRSIDRIGGFLSINYVNRENFYREYSPYREIRTNRFVESTGEISLPLNNSRLYLLSQYWVDLSEVERPAPQRLPEIGYVLNPSKVGPIWFSTTATASNFWREKDIYGQRLDIYPRILHTLGRDVVLSQTLGFREIAYFLQRSEEDFIHREAIEYNAIVSTRLLKRYNSFTHVIEPSLGYTLITDPQDLPVFDSTELFKKTSKIEFSLINRILHAGSELFILKASQSFDADLGDRPFLPFRLEIGIKKPISLRLDANYDVHQGELESINSDLRFNTSKANIWINQRYNKKDDISYYRAGFGMRPLKPWYLGGSISYDAKEKLVRDITIDLRYFRQCWGINMVFNKYPNDYSVLIMFELKGLTMGTSGLRPMRIF
ncbi:MAG: LPS-assembly protein LptD [Thermodesulfovibrionales bacterium]